MLNLRRANLGDLEALVRLRLELLREAGDIKDNTEIEAIAAATRNYLADKMPQGEFLVWVAEVENKIVATSGLVLFTRPPYDGNLSGLEAYIMNVYTIPQWRSQGIATALLKETISFVKETEAKRIWLHTNKDGKILYEKLGFISTTKEMEIVWH